MSPARWHAVRAERRRRAEHVARGSHEGHGGASGAAFPIAIGTAADAPPQHAFVLTFRNVRERDYYLDADPSHQAFKASIAEKVVDVVVFDFESGDFARRAMSRKRRPSDELHVRTV